MQFSFKLVKDLQSRQISRERLRDTEMTCCTFQDTNVFFYFPKFDRNRGSHWMHFFACICHTVFVMFSCLQINWQPFYLRHLLKFHPSNWQIEIYLQTEGQGTHHKMVSLQLMPGFSPTLIEFKKLYNNQIFTFTLLCLFQSLSPL